MALGLSASEANGILNNLGDTYMWIKLHIGDPGANGTGNGAQETDRIEVVWGTASGGTKSNTSPIQWTGVSNAEDYTHFSAWTASSSGTFGFSGTISANAVAAGDTFTIPTGDLDISLNAAA